MASITSFKITKVNKDSVQFAYDYEKNEGVISYDADGRIKTEREETYWSWRFTTAKNQSSSVSPCPYSPGGSGTDKYKLTATLTTTYIIYTYGWEYDRTYDTTSENANLSTRVGQTSKHVYTYLGPTEDKKQHKYRVSVYYWEIVETSGNKTENDSADAYFYPHPAEFTFNNCVQGAQWKVDDGIQKFLITNITDFQGQAQQRKNWKHQLDTNFSEYGECPSFFDKNIITRDYMNAVYRYVKEEDDDFEEFKEKDEKGNPIYHPISAIMFNYLADIINEKTEF